MLIKEKYEEVFQFLASYFHQDIESVDKSLKEFLEENSVDHIEVVITSVKDFLKDEAFDINEKTEFIEKTTSLYFPTLNSTPTTWLEKTVEYLETKNNKNK